MSYFHGSNVIQPRLLTYANGIYYTRFLSKMRQVSTKVFLLVSFSIARGLNDRIYERNICTECACAVRASQCLMKAFIRLASNVRCNRCGFRYKFLFLFIVICQSAASIILCNSKIILIGNSFSIITVTNGYLISKIIRGLMRRIIGSFTTGITGVRHKALSRYFRAFRCLSIFNEVTPIVKIGLFFDRGLFSLLWWRDGCDRGPQSVILGGQVGSNDLRLFDARGGLI